MNRHQRRSFLKKIQKKAFIPASVHEKMTGSQSISELIDKLSHIKNPKEFTKKIYDELVEDVAKELREVDDDTTDSDFEDED